MIGVHLGWIISPWLLGVGKVSLELGATVDRYIPIMASSSCQVIARRKGKTAISI